MIGIGLCAVLVVLGADVRLRASLPYPAAHRFCEITKQPILVILHQGQPDEAVQKLRATMAAAEVVMVVGEADATRYRNVWLAVGQPCMPAVVYLYWRDRLLFDNVAFPPVVPTLPPAQLRVWLEGSIGQLRPESRARLGLCPVNVPSAPR